MTLTCATSANKASKPFRVPWVSQTGRPWRRASLATPPMWSSCSCVTTTPERSVGSSPSLPRRVAVSASPKPQSSRMRVLPDSTTRALPWLPLPRKAKRIRLTRAWTQPAFALLQFRLQQGKDATGVRAGGLFALGIQHAHLAAVGAIRHADAVLLLLAGRIAAAPERELRQEAPGIFRHRFGIDIAHVIKALRTVAILHREADAVEGESDPAPRPVEAVAQQQHLGRVAIAGDLGARLRGRLLHGLY